MIFFIFIGCWIFWNYFTCNSRGFVIYTLPKSIKALAQIKVLEIEEIKIEKVFKLKTCVLNFYIKIFEKGEENYIWNFTAQYLIIQNNKLYFLMDGFLNNI